MRRPSRSRSWANASSSRKWFLCGHVLAGQNRNLSGRPNRALTALLATWSGVSLGRRGGGPRRTTNNLEDGILYWVITSRRTQSEPTATAVASRQALL